MFVNYAAVDMERDEPVVKWQPEHDRFGEAPLPAPDRTDACLLLTGKGTERLLPGDHLKFTDAAGTVCILEVVEAAGAGWRAECFQRAFVVSGTALERTATADQEQSLPAILVAELPHMEQLYHLSQSSS